MQKRFLSLSIIAVSAIILFASCSSKSNKQGSFIPKTAALVVHVNGESVTSKLPWDEIKKSDMFSNIYTDTAVAAYIKAALDNPENTGIDLKKDLLLFVQKDSLGGYAAIEGSIKDAAKFKQFNTEANKGATASEKDGVQFLAKEKTTTSWNKDRFIVVVDLPEMSNLNKMNNYNSMDTIPAASVKYRDGVSAATALYALKEDNSLAKDEKFSELMNTKGDLHFWFNGETFNAGGAGLSALSMVNLTKLTEGSIMAATANFENGKIIADIKSYSGKELTEIWKKYNGDKISTDMLKRIPSKDVAAVFALNFKPEGIREFIKLAGVEGFANMGASAAGFTLDDFIKANKGDLLISVADIKKDSFGSQDVNFLFSTSIGDKASFGKIVDAGKKYGANMGSMGVPQIFYNANEQYFAIGNKKESVDKYIASTSSTSFDYLDKITGSPAGGFVNFQYILNATKSNVQDSTETEMFNASLKMWDNLIFKGGEFKDGGVVQHLEVNLVDKNTNALKQLNSYLGVISVLAKKQKEEREKQWNTEWPATVDTTTMVTPAN